MTTSPDGITTDRITTEGIATEGIATVAELHSSGVTSSTVERRCRSRGPWRRLLPGVLLLGTTEPSRRQLLRAALAYAGRGAMITGADALRAGALAVDVPDHVHVLLPASRRIVSRSFVHVERTTRRPVPIERDGIPFAPPARATLDAARLLTDPVRIAALLTEPLRRGAYSVPELRHELDSGSQRGSARPRAVLTELSANVHSFAEAQARRLVADCPLPRPRWNVPVCNTAGGLLGVADAWWEDVGLAWDFGANEFRVAGFSESADHARRQVFAAHGVLVLRTSATQLAAEPARVRDALLRAHRRAGSRPRPDVRGHAEQWRGAVAR